MIDFTRYTYQAILAGMLAKVSDTFDKREGSMIQTALGPAAYALEEVYMTLDQLQDSAFIQTAVGDSLDLLAVLANVTRYPASPAVRLGVFNAPVPMGARFSTVEGEASINFAVTGSASGSDPGSYYYQLTAETPGAIGNQYAGPIVPITYLPSLTSAQITDILVPGDDTETDEAFRERIIEALTNKPFAGNVAAYRQDVLAIDGVGAVQVYPTWNGGGTVKLSILGADWAPASPTLVENVQNAIDPPPNQGLGYGLAPIGAQVTVAAPTAVEVNVSATLTLESGFQVEQVQQPVEEAVAAYLESICRQWGDLDSSGLPNYASIVYLSRVISTIVGVQGVVNATDVTLNGQAQDITLTETGTTQQVPQMGTVTLDA